MFQFVNNVQLAIFLLRSNSPTYLTYGSISALRMTHPLISGQGFLYFLQDFCHFSNWSALKTLQNFEKSSKIWQKKPCPQIYG